MKMRFINRNYISIYVSIFVVAILITCLIFYNDQDKVKVMTQVQVINYKTEYIYKDNIPSNVSKVITEGERGIVSIDPQTNSEEIIKETVNEVIEVGSAPVGEYVGTLTGYGPDCYGCSKVGNVACRTEKGDKHSLIYDGITYVDDEYGELRILAADHTLFPCGTIIEFSNSNIEPTLGVVLDTGSTMRSAWRNSNKVFIDLAFPSEKETSIVTNNKTTYSVKRWGW